MTPMMPSTSTLSCGRHDRSVFNRALFGRCPDATRLVRRTDATARRDGRIAAAALGGGALETPRGVQVAKSALLGPQMFRDLPPGPAYYDPAKAAPHSSFHLNARKRFV